MGAPIRMYYIMCTYEYSPGDDMVHLLPGGIIRYQHIYVPMVRDVYTMVWVRAPPRAPVPDT